MFIDLKNKDELSFYLWKLLSDRIDSLFFLGNNFLYPEIVDKTTEKELTKATTFFDF